MARKTFSEENDLISARVERTSLLAMFAILAGANFVGPILNAQVETGQTQENPFSISQPAETVLVRIENPLELPLELWSTGAAPKMLHAQSQELFYYRVDSGKYKLWDSKHKFLYPVPAITKAMKNVSPKAKQSSLKELRLTVGKPPAQDPKSTFAWIPSGPTLVGDELGVGHKDERLSIEYVDAFWIGKTEVTNQAFTDFLNTAGQFDEDWLDLESRKCRIKPIQNSPKKFTTDRPQEPVVMVSLAGALAYCDHLSKVTGQKHRLPTETEWERAARGPSSTVFSYGNTYQSHRANQESGSVNQVARFAPTPWQLYDMTGNVFEWMSNKYSPKQPDRIMNQALRGGSFVLDGMYLRNSFRMRQSPTVMTDDIGFRVVREVQAKDSDSE